MKTINLNRNLFRVLLPAVLLCSIVLAQEPPRTRSLTIGGKDVTEKSDGMEIKILKNVSNSWKLVGPNEKFKAGDRVKVQFWSNIKGYVYFVNIPPSGKQKVIYSQAIEKDRDYTLPGSDGNREVWIDFDDEKGIEILKLVMTPSPIKVFDDAINKSKGELGESVFSVTKELANVPKVESEQVAMISKNGGCPKVRELSIRCRSLGFAPSDPKSNKGAVAVAIPDSKNSSGKLAKDEAIVVELRLIHI
ncbi:MAG: DUF4384 domain-containing protein [Acidobacteria bacterium]|nr:DUF4384 domain-containing protein [Acidobacteriota bacterium]